MQDETHLRVMDCIGFGSWSAVHCVGDGGKLNGGYLVVHLRKRCAGVVFGKELNMGDGGKLNGSSVEQSVYLVVGLRTRCAGGKTAANVGGRPGVVYVEQRVILWLSREEPKWYVGSWLGGFEWAIIVGVDAVGARRAANVGGRSGAVYVEDCIGWLLGGKEPKRYVGSWLGGFELALFVGVDADALGKTGS
ncbi:hypothetical protein EAH_00066030 [Eimeria acervulina]|uniref:Uncharacterized protein n=1 Tax=Eimeria acervulina TaxID=5801 RepID=U6GRY2_EIMAC|nr:hypothetical protein EAH_00066030 [Eimeria acervulina]CDI82337.1 hypothetical protein EAH_00066030 [Eimeria acervulina]